MHLVCLKVVKILVFEEGNYDYLCYAKIKGPPYGVRL